MLTENPNKTKYKKQYLAEYRIKLGMSSNHRETLPVQTINIQHLSLKQLDQLAKPQLRQLKNPNWNIYSAALIRRIGELHKKQQQMCHFPTIKQRYKTIHSPPPNSRDFRSLSSCS